MLLTKESFKCDFKSSLVVSLIALPLCIGIAIASGTPVLSGLVAGVVGGVLTGLLSRSQVSVDGPAAGMVVIVTLTLNYLGGFPAFLLALFLSGLIQMMFGFLKLGKIGDYIPNSVIKGLLSGIGIIFIVKQVPHFFGYDLDFLGDESLHFTGIDLNNYHLGSVVIGLISLTILGLSEIKISKLSKIFDFLPAPIIVVLIGIGLNAIFSSQMPVFYLEKSHLVNLNYHGGISGFLNELTFPDWSFISDKRVFIAAAFIAVMTSIESLINIEASDGLDPFRRYTSKNRELVAQGAGNTVSGLLGGLPITSVIIRTTLNIKSGAQTKLSTIMHGVWLLIAAVFFVGFIEMIPVASIAAILLVLGWKMASVKTFHKMKRKGKNQFIPYIVTVLGIVFANILYGVIAGLFVSFIYIMRSKSVKAMVLVNNGSDYLLRFYKDVSFLNKPILTRLLKSVPAGSKLLIDGGHGTFIDDDIIGLLEDFLETAEHRNIKVEIRKSTLAINPFFKG